MAQKESAQAKPAGPRHIEFFFSSGRFEPIPIGCTCEIGRDHTYAEWVRRFQDPDRN